MIERATRPTTDMRPSCAPTRFSATILSLRSGDRIANRARRLSASARRADVAEASRYGQPRADWRQATSEELRHRRIRRVPPVGVEPAHPAPEAVPRRRSSASSQVTAAVGTARNRAEASRCATRVHRVGPPSSITTCSIARCKPEQRRRSNDRASRDAHPGQHRTIGARDERANAVTRGSPPSPRTGSAPTRSTDRLRRHSANRSDRRPPTCRAGGPIGSTSSGGRRRRASAPRCPDERGAIDACRRPSVVAATHDI